MNQIINQSIKTSEEKNHWPHWVGDRVCSNNTADRGTGSKTLPLLAAVRPISIAGATTAQVGNSPSDRQRNPALPVLWYLSQNAPFHTPRTVSPTI